MTTLQQQHKKGGGEKLNENYFFSLKYLKISAELKMLVVTINTTTDGMVHAMTIEYFGIQQCTSKLASLYTH